MERDTWYANCIATDPPYQGRGLATAIIDRVLADAATTRSVVALGTQSEENVSVWRNLRCIVQAKGSARRPRSIGTLGLSNAASWTPKHHGVSLLEIYSHTSLGRGAVEATRRAVVPHHDASHLYVAISLRLAIACDDASDLINGSAGQGVAKMSLIRVWVVVSLAFSAHSRRPRKPESHCIIGA